MTWWRRLLNWKGKSSSLYGLEYRVAFSLYSEDGKREVEVREFSNGETYVVEREWVEGTAFVDRHGGSMVGPFASPTAAETFSVGTRWFTGSETRSGPLSTLRGRSVGPQLGEWTRNTGSGPPERRR